MSQTRDCHVLKMFGRGKSLERDEIISESSCGILGRYGCFTHKGKLIDFLDSVLMLSCWGSQNEGGPLIFRL